MVDEERVVEEKSVSSTPTPGAAYPDETVTQRNVVSESVRRSPSGAEVARRWVVWLFAIIQGLIAIRIVLLLIDANQDNGLVQFIYNLSAFFIGPFEGVLKTNAVASGASVLDIAALVALVGWTILEALIIAGIGIMRREP
jgi:hypothetical protein